MLVAQDLNVLVAVVEDRLAGRQPELRERVRLAGQLLADLVEVVVIDVAVASGPDELARPVAGLGGDHVREQGIARDVERYTEEQVGAALVQLAAEGAVGDVELE